MNNVINLNDERKRRDQLELDGLERLVKDLVKDIDLASLSQPYYLSPLEMDMGYTHIQPLREASQLEPIISNLMKTVIDLDEIGHGDLADKLSDIVADAMCIHEDI